jgi:hypothetical protein
LTGSELSPKEWKNRLARWTNEFGCKTLPPPVAEEVANVEASIGSIPLALKRFYEVTNGLSVDSLYVLPIERAESPKQTWDSLGRANDPRTTRFLEWDSTILKRFLVFADIGGEHCAAFDREDGSIWYEDDSGFHQTDLDLAGFIEASLREGASPNQ